MSFFKLAAVAAVAAFGYIAPAAALTNLVTNGSFSQSTYTASSQFGSNFGGQGVTGWSASGFNLYFVGGTQTTTSAANQYNDTQTYFRTNFVASPDGGNFVALDGDSTLRGPLTQTITGLTSGKGYNLSFQWAATQLRNRTGATTEQLQVSFGGDTRKTQILSVPSMGFTGDTSNPTTTWFTQNFYFVANGTSQVLSFLSLGTPNGQPPIAVLDGVALTAVPEPATWALLLVGFGMIGFSARRRRLDVVVS